MPAVYYFAIADTLNGTVWPALLSSQISAVILSQPLRNVEVSWNAGTIGVWFDAPISAVDEVLLNAIVAAHNGTQQKDFSGFVNTATAAPTKLISVPTQDDNAYTLQLNIAARRTDATPKAFGKGMAVTARRGVGAASLIIIGSTTLYAHLEAPIAWTADVIPNLGTGALDVVVVGALASPIDWWGYAKVIEV